VIVPESVISKSLALFDGRILDTEADEEEGVPVWEVRISNLDGAEVKFYWRQEGESLFRIDGEKGPFDYDMIVGNGLINFNTAKLAAITAAKNNNIETWQHKQDDSFAGKWVYLFIINEEMSNLQVIIDADNGEVLEIE
jgi:uncharacterized membrane protein YkoI